MFRGCGGPRAPRSWSAPSVMNFAQANEAARCIEEGVVTDVRDADVGAILGWGFAHYTGGPISMIDTNGDERFAA